MIDARQVKFYRGKLRPVRMQNNPEQSLRQVPSFIRTLNSSTKWLVTLAHTIAVWSRPHKFHGPYIVVGTIAGVYLTEVLKKIINQGRPAGSPFTDPGMPSSHSLVSFFAAVAWISALDGYGGNIGKVLLLASAAMVAILRVVCGYHSIAQIAVGAALGSVLGQSWVIVGNMFHLSYPGLMFAVVWAAYLGGSAFFISKNMTKWISRDKHL